MWIRNAEVFLVISGKQFLCQQTKARLVLKTRFGLMAKWPLSLVRGAGLGRTYALALAERGAKVLVNDLGSAPDGTGGAQAPADKVVSEIKDKGGEAIGNYDSVATPEGGEAIVQAALKAFGRVDILVNNAGIIRDKSLAKMDQESWRQVREVHLNGAYNVTRPAFLHMREKGHGRIVMTSSAAGLYGNFGQTNYAAAKMGIVGFMNTLKLEGEKYNVKVNTVAPVAGTRLTQDLLPPNYFDKLKPEFIAPLVLYLCSDDCKETGMVFNAGMGFFNRAGVVAGSGKVIGDGNHLASVEDIHKNFDVINDLEGAQEYTNATAALGSMLEAFNPKSKEKQAGASDDGLSVAGIFEKMPEAFLKDKASGVDVVFQWEISGPDGGSWNVAIKNAECSISQGQAENPTTTIKMGDSDFLQLISGNLNAMQAYTSGKLKIEGDLMKSQLIEKLFKY